MKTQVKAFLPVDITDAAIISHTIPEPHADEPLFIPTEPYAEFANVSVIKANSHVVYESLQSDNLGHDPETSPLWWIKKSYTNRWRMFDLYQTKPSVGQSPMTFVLRPGKRINSVVLEGLKATLIDLVVRDGINGPIVYTLDGFLISRNANSYYSFFNAPFVYDRIVSAFDIPVVPDPVVVVTLQDPSGTCEVSRFGTGMAQDLGYVDWNTVVDDGSYSEITYDSAGWPTLQPIPGESTLEMTLDLDAVKVNAAMQFKRLSKRKLVFWSAMEPLVSYREMHVMIGMPEKFIITTENHRQARIDLKLRGL